MNVQNIKKWPCWIYTSTTTHRELLSELTSTGRPGWHHKTDWYHDTGLLCEQLSLMIKNTLNYQRNQHYDYIQKQLSHVKIGKSVTFLFFCLFVDLSYQLLLVVVVRIEGEGEVLMANVRD